MESREYKCRICLEENANVDWNQFLTGSKQQTYKDCYFKYTQLECSDDDDLSSMLCCNCSSGLQYVEALILQAIESYNILQNIYLLGTTVIKDENNVQPEALNFQTILKEEIEMKPETQNYAIYESASNEFDIEAKNSQISPRSENATTETNIDNRSGVTLSNDELLSYQNDSASITTLKNFTKDSKKISINTKFKLKTSPTDTHKVQHEAFNFKTILVEEIDIKNETAPFRMHDSACNAVDIESQNDQISSKSKYVINETSAKETIASGEKFLNNKSYSDKHGDANEKAEHNKTKKRKRKLVCDSSSKQRVGDNCEAAAGKTKKKYQCKYCSLSFSRRKEHEATHNKNRKRTETCPHCGTMFYTKKTLEGHMKIHDQNRQKHKCEFCNKGFYRENALRVHKRIHLGLMLKCEMCPKEFFRQIELDNHMSSHSSDLNVEPKKKSKYFVRCEYCSKTIMSTSFKSHIAAHRNEPLMQCSICNKEFFTRYSCTGHLKSVHKKTTAEYNDYIIIYKNHRTSHLYIKQTAELVAEVH